MTEIGGELHAEAEALRGQLRAAVDEMNLRNQQEASRAQWELEQLRARLGQRHLAAHLFKQLCAQLVFQRL